MTEDFHFLDKKILRVAKIKKQTIFTYEELKYILQPYDVDEYILFSKILYEYKPNFFKLIPPLEKEIYDEQNKKFSEPNKKTFRESGGGTKDESLDKIRPSRISSFF